MSELTMGWPVPPENDVKPVIDNRFELQSTLGIGSVGEVFLALDFSVDPPRQVALKRLHPELLSDRVAVEQLQREAELTNSVSHPNILKIYHAQFRPDIAYIVTELARQPLSKIPLPLPLDIVADYLERLATALDYAHSQGLLHRDIKPENVLTGDLGKIMLADFSLAVSFDKNLPHYATIPAEAWGTPFYAAPEVWNGHICKASDNYALGILIYQLVVGHPPFDGTPDELEQLHLTAPVPWIGYNVVYPPALYEVFTRVLHKDPAQRPPTNLEFYRMFQWALRTRYIKPETPHDVYELYPNSDPNWMTRGNSSLARVQKFTAFSLMAIPFMCFALVVFGAPGVTFSLLAWAFAFLCVVSVFAGILSAIIRRHEL